jgi:PhzF family phenazine biosynthesis protein
MEFHEVDVFTDVAGRGNPLGVVIGADGWDSTEMQRFAAWTGLVETTYLRRADDGDGARYQLKIFTPQQEIAFAGHPSIGSAHVALATGLVTPRAGRLIQSCRAGELEIAVENAGAAQRLAVRAPAARVLEEATPTALAALLRTLTLGALPPALVEGGRRWWIIEAASEAELRGFVPNSHAIAAFAVETQTLGVCAFARSDDANFDLVVRAFPCGVGIVEDPASGAANGLIAARIGEARAPVDAARCYRVSQGREIGRDARLTIRYDDAGIWVGGASVTVIAGRLHWP